MSQAKVDQYKKDKMNRKKNVQKDKVKRAFVVLQSELSALRW